MKQVDERELLAALWGGAVLGGGGGASPKAGYILGKVALDRGPVYLASPDELDPEGIVVTAGLVGSPKAGGMGPDPDAYIDAFSFLEDVTGTKISAVNSNECGGLATVNGWLQAAGLGVPVVDAPCNGRAHPTALMGAIGLHKDVSYISRQAAVGKKSRLYVEGPMDYASAMVRALSAKEGLVAVARNPVTVSYLSENGAYGAITMCIELGTAMAKHIEHELGFDPLRAEFVGGVRNGEVSEHSVGYFAANAASAFLNGLILSVGVVGSVEIGIKGGFDVGEVQVISTDSDNAQKELARLTFMNEYLTCDVSGHTLFSFPDLISVFDAKTGWPVASADIREGMEILVVGTSMDNLILGAGMYDKELYLPLEEAVGRVFEPPVKR
ncbi:MAG: DUF917 family protein [Bacillota bacterium]|jgi:DUF917 family protein